ncbi:hypothetical protein GCM10018955_75250 [Planomonospora venezuelensis]
MQAKTAWLSRDFASTVPHAEQRWEVYAGGTRTIREPLYRALCSRMVSRAPQPLARMARFSSALAATLTPGAATVPFAPAVMFRIFRSSTTTMPWPRVSRLAVQAGKSVRRLRIRTFNPAICARVAARRAEPFFCRANCC